MSGSEIIFIVLLALVVLGPEKLPEVMRRVGRTYGEFKRMSSSFQDEFRSQIDEPMREMRDTADLIRRNVDIGAAQVEKPKSVAAMSVDIESDPPPNTAAAKPQVIGPIEPDDDSRHDGTADDPGRDHDAEGSGVADDGEVREAPGAVDGFGSVPSYADHDASGPDEQADTEQTR
jgi:sec-independent protein translocase protein TatB